ncbi:SDR family NAD(P)-dependent oxidoreductase [Streptomyces diastatochromogenes]|uniref:Short-chain dehydrogenase n=1 Tax=Streptomyces diastatochromogenes TaxID=42236 RepID=A0A233S285_STRDA|nr:SDR family oxidoreductase [Streptomyces diastatochromogenes]MCZ0991627.1 SDR family NAD(P)-dependent oxidoreductase [Streptomyces diastatochromogenes]OXY89693.1 hypothetical protein BEK98_37425 [Streptomyces diastatochromogenes]
MTPVPLPIATPRTALVTGASQGGLAVAERLVQDGVRVALNGRQPQRLTEAANRLRRQGGTVLELPCDAGEATAMAAAVDTVTSTWGGLDLVVDNAGVGGPSGPTWEIPAQEWWKALEDNLRTTLVGACAAIPAMLAGTGGRIIHISSEAGHSTWPYVSAYSTAKAGAIKLTENLARELRNLPVTVFAYHPGIMETGLTQAALTHRAPANPWSRRYAAWFARQIEKGNSIPITAAVDALVTLASGPADHLHGRFLTTVDITTLATTMSEDCSSRPPGS